MSIAINNNSYDYNSINLRGKELETQDGVYNTTEGEFAQKINQIGKVECQTCSDRKYQDVSNDLGVSFKTPGKIAPENAAAAVMSHEQEHVRNETAKAAKENRQIVSQSVTLQTSTCPECGKAYVSGGNTRTVTKTDNSDEKKDYFITNYNDTVAKNFGLIVDVRV
ncbi:MAG: hypothetical protein ACYDG2_17935 [Ruminiclostridium sp.]